MTALLAACGSSEPPTRPPTTSAAFDPACTDALACVTSALTPPAGVTTDPRDRDAVLAGTTVSVHHRLHVDGEDMQGEQPLVL